jgi:uncharacterized damage-inducible protein DinB
MNWIAPPVDRVEPPYVADDERASLDSWLDYHRNTLLWKCAGLTGEQLTRTPVAKSTLSLLGLVRHMADVERIWFRFRFAGEPVRPIYWSDEREDADFELVDPANAEADFAAFAAEVAAARQAAAGRSLEEPFTFGKRQIRSDLRWVYVHMIEEYARHNGHADLIRELVDGATGD